MIPFILFYFILDFIHMVLFLVFCWTPSNTKSCTMNFSLKLLMYGSVQSWRYRCQSSRIFQLSKAQWLCSPEQRGDLIRCNLTTTFLDSYIYMYIYIWLNCSSWCRIVDSLDSPWMRESVSVIYWKSMQKPFLGF